MLFELDKKSSASLLEVELRTLLHRYLFAQLFGNKRIRTEHSIPKLVDLQRFLRVLLTKTVNVKKKQQEVFCSYEEHSMSFMVTHLLESGPATKTTKQRWSRGHKARSQGQGHKKIRGQGQEFSRLKPRTKDTIASVFLRKKVLKIFFGRSPKKMV